VLRVKVMRSGLTSTTRYVRGSLYGWRRYRRIRMPDLDGGSGGRGYRQFLSTCAFRIFGTSNIMTMHRAWAISHRFLLAIGPSEGPCARTIPKLASYNEHGESHRH
jgi:hypothetical protein